MSLTVTEDNEATKAGVVSDSSNPQVSPPLTPVPIHVDWTEGAGVLESGVVFGCDGRYGHFCEAGASRSGGVLTFNRTREREGPNQSSISFWSGVRDG